MSALVNRTDSGIFAALKGAQLLQQAGIESSALTSPDGADLDPMAVHEEIGKARAVPVYIKELSVVRAQMHRFAPLVAW